MKIQIASDLHIESFGPALARETVIRPLPEADPLVLAGDIANGTDAIRPFQNWPVNPVAPDTICPISDALGVKASDLMRDMGNRTR